MSKVASLFVFLLAAGCAVSAAPDEGVVDGPTLDLSGKAPPAPSDVTYYVKAGAKGGNGTAKRPFGAIGDAIAAGKKANALSVTIQVADGVYEGDVTIDRKTYIRGQSRASTVLRGSITNPVVATLGVEKLKLQPLAGHVGIRTAAVAPLDGILGGWTVVNEVRIENPSPYGIEQIGGTLGLYNVEIVGARHFDGVSDTDPGQIGDGAAIRVASGAKSLMQYVVLSNDAQGILAEGVGTLVSAPVGVGIYDTAGGPTVGSDRPRAAAVNVFAGARFQANGLEIFRSKARGLQVIHATARVEYSKITELTSVDANERWAVVAFGDTDLELSATKLTAPGAFGLGIGDEARVSFHHATKVEKQCYGGADQTACVAEWYAVHGSGITGFDVGIVNQGTATPLDCVLVVMKNAANVAGGDIGLPAYPTVDGSSSVDVTTDTSACVQVPWVY